MARRCKVDLKDRGTRRFWYCLIRAPLCGTRPVLRCSIARPGRTVISHELSNLMTRPHYADGPVAQSTQDDVSLADSKPLVSAGGQSYGR